MNQDLFVEPTLIEPIIEPIIKPGPSYKQSQENYDHLVPRVKAEIEGLNVYLKVTSVIVLDELLCQGLISPSFHKHKIKECLTRDKADEKKDLFWSMMISALITGYFMMYIVPQGEYYLFKFFFGLYISIIIYLGSMFRTKQD